MIDQWPVWYSNFTNMDADPPRPYRRGDRLVRGFTGDIDWRHHERDEDLYARLLERHNRDDRPDWEQCPAMSIGDVIMFRTGHAVTVARNGFTPVTVAGSDLIVDRPWIDLIAGIDVLPEHPPLPLSEKLIWGEDGLTSGAWLPLPWDQPPISLERGNGTFYECWFNVDHGWQQYRPGDRLVWGWGDIVSWIGVAPPLDVLAEAIVDQHDHVNFRDVGRGDFGALGDVVMVGDVAMSAKGCGFCRVDTDPADLIVDRCYRDVACEPSPDIAVDRPAGRNAAVPATPWPDADVSR